ncbi:Putative protein disulfide-isomerase [Nosema bombycis CQ1]|uniref:protein disulfide-isomerase n=1 Tax=Nosema bombycis (strain CQ1 / CVCC 102059) TaxID=578461 RepID=R0KTN7_NOSB1|nr:Putative protein disulfide-isomerase [Nosema bombycis CQ1]|eukprot:EOB13597.1 Putative protein disulfide-isomerase [Nosema bombycis CQ1]
MKFLIFISLLLAEVQVDRNLKKEEQKDKPKIAIDFFGKQMSIFEDDVPRANEIISKFKLPPSDINKISSNLDNIVSDPEAELRRGERSFALYFVDEKTILSTSDHVDDNISVFISTDENLAKSMDCPFPGVYAYSALDKVAYRIPLEGRSSKNINAVIKTPILGPISYENFGLYRATEMPLLYLFSRPDEMEKTKKLAYEKAKKCRNVGKFVIIPFDSARITPDVFGFTEVDLPTLVFINEKSKYNLPNADTKDFEVFISDVIEGRAVPFYASETEPENNEDRDLKVITRNNLNRILEESTKDRLVVFSSPECGFCRTFKPILEDLGKIVKENANDKLFVGSSDITLNDIPDFDVSSVPVIFLIKSGTNERIKMESGDRTLLSLAKFIKEKGGHSVDLTPYLPKEEEPIAEKPVEELPVEEPVPEKISEREEL